MTQSETIRDDGGQVKLTKAQIDLLRELPTHTVQEYRPAQRLVQLGLAYWETLSRLEITDAGRAALSKTEARK